MMKREGGGAERVAGKHKLTSQSTETYRWHPSARQPAERYRSDAISASIDLYSVDMNDVTELGPHKTCGGAVQYCHIVERAYLSS